MRCISNIHICVSLVKLREDSYSAMILVMLFIYLSYKSKLYINRL